MMCAESICLSTFKFSCTSWSKLACVLQVEHWKEQAGLSPKKRQMVDLLDVQDERWKNPDLDQQSVYSPKPN